MKLLKYDYTSVEDDAIAQLSEQVIALTARMHQNERKQQLH
jgi:hypothetical protein